jgi:hypothetical protein
MDFCFIFVFLLGPVLLDLVKKERRERRKDKFDYLVIKKVNQINVFLSLPLKNSLAHYSHGPSGTR